MRFRDTARTGPTKATGNPMERSMKDAEIIDFIEHLRRWRKKANVLPFQQLELTND